MMSNNPPELPPVDGIDTGVIMEAEVAAPQPAPPVEETQAAKAKRNKKLPLTPHEAIHYFARGIYVDVETGQLRCSCNHKPCDKWDAYGYNRHFTFKCHKKYEEERLNETEANRLKEAHDTYVRMHPEIAEASIRKRRKLNAKDGEKLLSVEELRVQERHWMNMWKDAKSELKQLRDDLKNEEDEEVRAELMGDIEGLKRRKGDWANLLGLNNATGATTPGATTPGATHTETV